MPRVLLAGILAWIAVAPAVHAAPQTDCRTRAIHDLERLAPQGFRIYAQVRNKQDFLRWITCDDVHLGLATGVHETVHLLTEEQNAFPLIGGGSVPRLQAMSRFFPPKQIAGRFDAQDAYVQTYLRPGQASSADHFLYLLDELNAYSHDLNAAVQLVSLRRRDRDIDHRDGLAALMSFVMTYVETARSRHASTWQGLQQPEARKVLQTLWAQAETVLASSCAIPRFGREDRRSVVSICERANSGALGELLGRSPRCPSRCLPAGTASIR